MHGRGQQQSIHLKTKRADQGRQLWSMASVKVRAVSTPWDNAIWGLELSPEPDTARAHRGKRALPTLRRVVPATPKSKENSKICSRVVVSGILRTLRERMSGSSEACRTRTPLLPTRREEEWLFSASCDAKGNRDFQPGPSEPSNT